MARISVVNNTSEPAALTENMVSLTTKSHIYETDSRAQEALLSEGHPPVLIETVPPHSTLSGEIAFDVHQSLLHLKPSLRFSEPSLGAVHGSIALPSTLR